MSNAAENREKISNIRKRMNTGVITREQAKEEAQPIIDEINTKAKELAKKYHQRPARVDFVGLMR